MVKKTTQNQTIRIRLRSYDSRLLDDSAQRITQSAKGTGAIIAGPIPLPTDIEKCTVNRSPHIDKKSMDQFERRTHYRLIEIKNPTVTTVDELKRLLVPAGVDITVRIGA